MCVAQPKSAFGFTFEVINAKAFQFVSINSKLERITRIEKGLFCNISECAIYLMLFAGISEFTVWNVLALELESVLNSVCNSDSN